jgi:hypothetical protein
MPKNNKTKKIIIFSTVAASIILVVGVVLWGFLTKWKFFPSKHKKSKYHWQTNKWIPTTTSKLEFKIGENDAPTECKENVNCNQVFRRAVTCEDPYGNVNPTKCSDPKPMISYRCKTPCNNKVFISFNQNVYIVTNDMSVVQGPLPNFTPEGPIIASIQSADSEALLLGAVGATWNWTYSDSARKYPQFTGSQWVPLNYDVSGYDGAKFQMAAFKSTQKAWISKDYGKNFTQVPVPDPSNPVINGSCTMSFDGKFQIFFFDSYILYSQDSGQTWTSHNKTSTLAGSIARAQNTNPLMVRVTNKSIFLSTLVTPEKKVYAFGRGLELISAKVDMSNNGNIIVVSPGPSMGPLYISRDFGTTWDKNTSVAPSVVVYDLTVSGDGKYIVAVGHGLMATSPAILYSNDYGKTLAVSYPKWPGVIAAATVTMSKITGPNCGAKTGSCVGGCCVGLSCIGGRCCEGPNPCAENTFFVTDYNKLNAYLDPMTDPALVFTNPGSDITAVGVSGNKRNFLAAASNGLYFSSDGLNWLISVLHGPNLNITEIAMSETGQFQLLAFAEKGIWYSKDGGSTYQKTLKGASENKKTYALSITGNGGFVMAFQEDGIWLGSSVDAMRKTAEANVLSGVVARSALVQLKVKKDGIYTATTGNDWTLRKPLTLPFSANCDISNDGTVLVVVGHEKIDTPASIWISKNKGQDWKQFSFPSSPYFQVTDLAVSKSGTTIVVTGNDLTDTRNIRRGYYLSDNTGNSFNYQQFQGQHRSDVRIVASK